MERSSKLPSTTFGVVLVLLVVGLVLFLRPANDERTPAERQKLADALLTLLRSPMAEEMDDPKPDDPRIPLVIRALLEFNLQVARARGHAEA